MREAVIIAAVRTPTGKFQGPLSALSAVDLGACVVREVVRRALKELGIQMISAYSPQSRGRSERTFSAWTDRTVEEYKREYKRRYKEWMAVSLPVGR